MKKPVLLAGPYKGLMRTPHPQQVQPGLFTDVMNFRFRYGKAQTIPDLTLRKQLLTAGFGTLIELDSMADASGDVWTIAYGTDRILYGDLTGAAWTDVSAPGWGLVGAPTEVCTAHHSFGSGTVVGGAVEYVLALNRTDPYLFYWADFSPVGFQQFSLDDAGAASPLPYTHARFVLPYADRILFGHMFDAALAEYPHVVAYTGEAGPLDNDIANGAGDNPLQDVGGPITGMALIQDLAAIFTTATIYVAKSTGIYEFPFHWRKMAGGAGCLAWRTIKPLFDGQALVFLGRDNLYIFDGNKAIPVGDAVADLIRTQARFNAGRTEITNVFGLVARGLDEYWLVFEDYGILVWNYRENWFSIYEFADADTGVAIRPTVAADHFVADALVIDDLPAAPIDNMVGMIDDPESLAADLPLFGTGISLYTIASQVVPAATLEFPQFRFAQPTTISRLTFLVDAPAGGTLEIQYSLDGGTAWSDWTAIPISPGTAQRAFYNKILTGIVFQLRVRVLRTVDLDGVELSRVPQLTLVDVQADISAEFPQEEVTPRDDEYLRGTL